MRIVLLAPGALPPFTEGRKRFVVDIAQTMLDAGHDVTVLTGSPRRSLALMMVKSLSDLNSVLRRQKRIDAVAVFPFGTFNGVRGRLNHWFVRCARRLSARYKVDALPIIYSCAGLTVKELSVQLGPAVAIGRAAPKLSPAHLGIRCFAQKWRGADSDQLRRILFLCGYQSPRAKTLENVLSERGLRDLLLAGESISRDGIRLTIAIPFFRHAAQRERLSALASQLCPNLQVTLEFDESPEKLFLRHDAFVFPYRVEHAVFIPTSLLEAMAIGIPVVASDHDMYGSLTRGPLADRCALHKAGDPMDLARALSNMKNEYPLARERAKTNSFEITKEWNLTTASKEILEQFSKRSP